MNIDYPNILETVSEELVEGRTESHSFLLWFLKHYYRLDDFEAADAVCDGVDDKGIDGIYVDDNLETVGIFQCKLVQNPVKTLGDTQLKEFTGTLAQLEDSTKIGEIADSTSNIELANLIKSENIVEKVLNGYSVQGIFLTNIPMDVNANKYLGQITENIKVYDKELLELSYIDPSPTDPIATPITFDIFGYDCSEYKIGDSRIVFAPIMASELVLLDGLSSNDIFAWNVRSSLGRTKVNKDIELSIEDSNEHKNFLLFHNGLTLLCENVELSKSKVTISGYSVVNGCQSLVSLFNNKDKITDELRLLARLIELPRGSTLAEKITHHSNNQNPINARDLQSNSVIQRRLQNEFQQTFGDDVVYRIKRGGADGQRLTIDNDEIGRMLLAFDLKQPWTCHQSYKVLDELTNEIFARPEVTAERVYVINLIGECVLHEFSSVDNKRFSNYRLTRYFVMYLVRLAIEEDKIGMDFCQNPSSFLRESDGEERIKSAISAVIGDLIIDLNAEINDRSTEGNEFDFKRDLKSPNPAKDLAKSIIPLYQKAVARKRAKSFGGEWDNESDKSSDN